MKFKVTSVRFVDKGLQGVIRRVLGLDTLSARVGILGGTADKIHPLRNTLTIGDVALMQEFGSSRAGIPQRSYLRSTKNENHGKIFKGFYDVARQVVLQSINPVAGLTQLGGRVAELVRLKILSGDVAPQNAPYTIERKGHGQTLQDTMTLSHSITNDVVVAKSTAGVNVAEGEQGTNAS